MRKIKFMIIILCICLGAIISYAISRSIRHREHDMIKATLKNNPDFRPDGLQMATTEALQLQVNVTGTIK